MSPSSAQAWLLVAFALSACAPASSQSDPGSVDRGDFDDQGAPDAYLDSGSDIDAAVDAAFAIDAAPPIDGATDAGQDAAPGSDAMPSDAAAGCVEGTVEDMACGLNGRGLASQICRQGEFVPDGACVDPDACQDDAEERAPCDPRRPLERIRRCSNGQWAAWSDCVPSQPECPDIENPACGPALPELCDGWDNDHDGEIDETPTPSPIDVHPAWRDRLDGAHARGLPRLYEVAADLDANDDLDGMVALALLDRPFDALEPDVQAALMQRLQRGSTIRGVVTWRVGAVILALDRLAALGGPQVLSDGRRVDATRVHLLNQLLDTQTPRFRGGWARFQNNGPSGQTIATHLAVRALTFAGDGALTTSALAQARVFAQRQHLLSGGARAHDVRVAGVHATAAAIAIQVLTGAPPDDPTILAGLRWLADALDDGLPGRADDWESLWALSVALPHVAPDDPRFARRHPVELGVPEANPGWRFDMGAWLLESQQQDGTWDHANSFNTFPTGVGEGYAHVMAMLLLNELRAPIHRPRVWASECDDGIDNDADGLVDADDPECVHACTRAEAPQPACDNQRDDDRDGLVDRADPDCAHPGDTDEGSAPACDNRVDDDVDGRTDWPLDPGCSSRRDVDEVDPEVQPQCANGRDDDGDGLADMDDPDCVAASGESERSGACADGRVIYAGNQTIRASTQANVVGARCGGDGPEATFTVVVDGPAVLTFTARAAFPVALHRRTVCADPDTETVCRRDGALTIRSEGPERYVLYVDALEGEGGDFELEVATIFMRGACLNQVDDDGDGLVDLADPGCIDAGDLDESNRPDATPACSNRADDDDDGRVDWPFDPGCEAAGDPREAGDPMGCANGLDDDGDGLIDWPMDTGCTSVGDPSEFGVGPACANGIDDDADDLIDLFDPGCRDANGDQEENEGVTACSNRVDDDFDGLIDYPADPGCLAAGWPTEADAFETACANGIDDDDDGAIDWPEDPGCIARTDPNERDPEALPMCADGIDNLLPGDGIDWPADAQCVSAADPSEGGIDRRPACSDGYDNDADGLIDTTDPGCRHRFDPDETDEAELPECANGIDDDGDGQVDWPADRDCAAAGGRMESADCPDGVDIIDMEDFDPLTLEIEADTPDNFDACGADPGQGDLVVRFRVPEPSRVEFRRNWGRSRISIRHNCGDVGSELACNDGTIRFSALEPGTYFAIIDDVELSARRAWVQYLLLIQDITRPR